MSFYITLPSNSSNLYFPNNTLNNFTTKLHSTLRLDGEYEVGLVEISYPQNWKYHRDGSLLFKEKNRSEIFKVKFSNYDKIENLLQSINDFCKFKSPPIPSTWTYNKTNQTINVQLTNPLIIEFIDGLNEELGFKYNIISASFTKDVHAKFIQSPPFQSNPISNIIRTITGLYVYCNIINYQFVGNTYAPLLRTITINENSDNYGKYIISLLVCTTLNLLK